MGESSTGTWTNMRYSVIAACMLVVLFGLVNETQAHKVNLFAYVEGDQIIVEGYFSGNAKAMNCVVDVLDNTGKKLLEGKTNTQGIYSFKMAELPAFTGDLKIILHAGQGHMTDFTLPAADLPTSAKGGTMPSAVETKTPETQAPSEKVAREQTPVTSPAVSSAGMDTVALKKVLEETLDAKIQPLVKMVGNQQKMLLEQKEKGPSMVEILGGIGWILGILGTAAYFAGRNRPENR